MKKTLPPYRILIIDDHAFPVRGYLTILLEKLGLEFKTDVTHKVTKIKTIYDSVMNINNADVVLEDKYRTRNFKITDKATITVYNYDASKSPNKNQKTIVALINKKEINVFWTDRGHSLARKEGNNLFGSKNGYGSKADLFFGVHSEVTKNKKVIYFKPTTGIVDALIKNKVRQIAVFSFNPLITQSKINETRNDYKTAFTNKNYKVPDDIYFLETSPILNLFNKTDKLASGADKNGFYGTVDAYKKYGQLLGSVLYDLFLQLSENKAVLTSEGKRYNFYNKYNRDGLRYLKLLNSISLYKDFKLGLISFFGKIYGQEYFLLDVPYKEYYINYDNLLDTENIKQLFEFGETEEEKWIYYKYKLQGEKFKYWVETSDNINSRKEVQKFLPLLHTAIFYEPNFHKEKKYPFSKFKLVENDDFLVTDDCNFVEVFYFFRNTKYEGMETEVLHYAVWRRGLTDNDKIKETSKEIEEKYYRLVEPKVKETTITILQIETVNQATRAAISQVMARNTSHNIGAHVMNKLIGDLRALSLLLFDQVNKHNYKSTGLKELHSSLVKELENSNWYKDTTDNILKDKALKNEILLAQISHFNNYIKCRMDYLADISFGTPLMQTNKYAYGELFTELDKVRLLLEHISGLDNFKFEIKFTRNGKEFKKDNNSEGADDLMVAIPNDILGTQAFYNILENIIRNTAKHSSLKPDITIFTVIFIDRLPSHEEMDFCQCENSKECNCGKPTPAEIQNILNEFIAVEVYDNIPVVGAVRELIDEDKREYKEIMGKELKPFKEKIDEIVFAQNKNLNEDILHENKLRSYSLGLVEMDASAAYLRKRPVEYINHPSYNIQYDESWSRDTELNGGNQEIRGINCRHFLKAFKTKEEFEVTIQKDENKEEVKKGSALGYRFFLHRPAVVLVVTKLLEDDKEKKEKLKKEGIWIITKAEFEKDLAAGKVFPHEFVIHTGLQGYETEIQPEERKVKFLEDFKTSLPIRIIELKNEDLKDILEKDAEKVVCDCWIRWEKRLKHIYQVNEVDMGSSVNPRFKGFQAVFLDHLNSNNEESIIAVDKWKQNLSANHLEALSSIAQSKMPDFYNAIKNYEIDKTQSNKTFDYYVGRFNTSGLTKIKLTEALFTKVVVIDERIQEAAEKRDFMSVPFKCLYSKMNVRVPDKSINLSANSYTDSIKNDIERYIVSQTANANFTDFILIHYSIFERMYSKDVIKENLKRLLGNSPINVVFTSGRGTPDNLGEDVRFVNLSSVISAFVEIRSKYTINYLLNSTRKSKIS